MNAPLIYIQGYKIRSALFQTQPWDGCTHGGTVFTRLSNLPKPCCQSIPRDTALRRTNYWYYPTDARFWFTFFQRRVDNPTTTRPVFFKYEWTPCSRIYDGYYPECARECQEHCLWWISTGEFSCPALQLAFFWFISTISQLQNGSFLLFHALLFSRKITFLIGIPYN